jgi:hypothetical protein
MPDISIPFDLSVYLNNYGTYDMFGKTLSQDYPVFYMSCRILEDVKRCELGFKVSGKRKLITFTHPLLHCAYSSVHFENELSTCMYCIFFETQGCVAG